LAFPAAAQVGLGLSPMRLETRIDNAAPVSGVLRLSNEADSNVRVRAELLDFYLDDQATPQFQEQWPRESDYSCRPYLSLNPMELELAPSTTALVRYTLRLPSDASSRSFHCAAGFTTLPTDAQIAANGILTAVRVVGAFYVVHGEPAVEGQIMELGLDPLPDPAASGWTAYARIENFSNVYFRPLGTLSVETLDGVTVEESQLPPIPVLPRRSQVVPVKLSTPLEPGRYRLRARVDIGMRQIQEATVVVEASRGMGGQAPAQIAALQE
jgi:hypothetical protein